MGMTSQTTACDPQALWEDSAQRTVKGHVCLLSCTLLVREQVPGAVHLVQCSALLFLCLEANNVVTTCCKTDFDRIIRIGKSVFNRTNDFVYLNLLFSPLLVVSQSAD